MPMYEFHCRACGTVFEKLLWKEPEQGARCACGAERAERVPYSRVAVATGHSASPAAGPTCADQNGGCCGGGACQTDWA